MSEREKSPTDPLRVAVHAVLLALLSLLGAARELRAHDPPAMLFEWTLSEEKLVWRILAKALYSDEWIPIPRGELFRFTPQEKAAAQTIVTRFFAAGTEPLVRLDGVVVAPVLEKAELVDVVQHDGLRVGYLVIDLAFGCKGIPRRVELHWPYFEAFRSAPFYELKGVFAWNDRDWLISMSADEPGYTWHRPAEKRVPIEPPPFVPPEPWSLPLPLLSMGALLAGGCLAVALRRRMAQSALTMMLVAAAALAGGLWNFARYDVPLPWDSGVALPSEEQALYIFESLHRNVYRAFDYKQENDIYDTLARSVEGSLLGEVYEEVYQSLIWREQGGAVCEVRRVEILDDEVALPAEPEVPQFEVQCRWRVHGRVGHFGHQHLRTNEYLARYLVRQSSAGWRIAEVKILQQERVPVEGS